MVVIDWLQTYEFVRVNAEKFILYCLCGCLTGISIILFAVTIILCIEKYFKVQDSYLSPETDTKYDGKINELPVYRYNGRTHKGFYDV
ncbi:unnamed protein product [Adineta steineri]|uniref:Uncharacterized protein n=1 Tax=Adineta steineri TaxID=433720 RepID=A0A814VE62_9BILA|nr:unnamed protein product [Adineta steineri]CAF1298094.1 unnamed protein product [Adineta steineri]